jgi:hypothetical protein
VKPKDIPIQNKGIKFILKGFSLGSININPKISLKGISNNRRSPSGIFLINCPGLPRENPFGIGFSKGYYVVKILNLT